MGDIAFRSSLAYSWHDLSTSRSVAIPGLSEQLSAAYGAQALQAFGELAYRVELTNATTLEPFANLTYVRLGTDAYAESGGAAALTSAASLANTSFTTLGLRASHQFAMGTVLGTAHAMVGWQHGLGDLTPAATLAFAGGSSFTVTGRPAAADTALLATGLDLNLNDTATVGLSYNGRFAKGATDNGVSANLNVRF